ncbi:MULTISPECIES: alpha-L-fucosidase [unclassified Sphingobacterium]|uniref:alpha-L-fucosidase n=1 Tax=unclassified Sphingobacterium TaxID=2609468 RepID=UPI00143B4929|nr:alpha-L-fucosidase [Sphingobacterium sp. B16(2022)]NJI74268.1 alpha-1,3/4-fucosidase [Sphingobacterium sp. B16(2022)]
MNKSILLTSMLGFASIYGHAQVNSKKIPVKNTYEIKSTDSPEDILRKAVHVVPTANQYQALKNEFIAFIHVGPNTFTKMEWGNGMEDPKIFDLKNLDTDQWCEAMKAAGMKKVIITVKHHDGFVLWQSRYTKHGIMSTGFREGKGDILKDLTASCKKYGLKLGVYLSPADLFQIESPEGLYGNLSEYTQRTIPREVEGRPFKNKTKFNFKVDDYNEYFLNQLFELLTEYGPVHEVWFDGAHPKTKGGQKYNYDAWRELIKKLAPEAVIFGKEDIRWCGNESGNTRSTEWNVIPYNDDPAGLQNFLDLTDEDLGSRAKILKAKYLHYQQAETNTSIREGWFYRDDTHQKVRSTDDVFDIYERSVGGNSTFLLNIPPNRDGKFSPEDVKVLHEVGSRIKETYGQNLLRGAKGSKETLDDNMESFTVLSDKNPELIYTLAKPVKINRFVIQEAVSTNGERIEKHALDAWIDGQWKEIAHATNVGYKRILRFPEVTSDKFRIRILESRATPIISNVAAHYAQGRPPQLVFNRSVDGMVAIAPSKSEFGWKPHGEDILKNLNTNFQIHYTLDGSKPTAQSPVYTQPIAVKGGQIKAVAISADKLVGAVAEETIGIAKKQWKIIDNSSEVAKHDAKLAFDADPKTYWQSNENGAAQHISIDLGQQYNLTAFSYTPQKENGKGMMAKGVIKISNDGKNWSDAERFEFGNLINDPTKRTHRFSKNIQARYITIESTEITGGGKLLTVAELDFIE